MIVVSDTSPITNLIQIGKLDLLKQIFGEIIIPQKVFEELSIYEEHKDILTQQDWIKIEAVNNKALVSQLEEKLDAGEAEAIILAQELNAQFLIIDERKGREIASQFGLNIVGLLGVLIQGKKKGYLNELKPILNHLINEIGFRVSVELYKRILQEVNE